MEYPDVNTGLDRDFERQDERHSEKHERTLEDLLERMLDKADSLDDCVVALQREILDDEDQRLRLTTVAITDGRMDMLERLLTCHAAGRHGERDRILWELLAIRRELAYNEALVKARAESICNALSAKI